jgi:AraC-like DNA-binding protein
VFGAPEKRYAPVMRPLPEFGWVSAGLLTPVVAVLRADGHDATPVLAEGNVAEVDLRDPMRRITIQAATRVWQAALRKVPDPAFGVRAALLVDSGDLDLLACLSRSCGTLEEALRFTIQFGSLMDETLACSLRHTSEGCFFSLGPRSAQYLPVVAEYVLLRLVVMGQKMLGTDEGRPREVHFAHHRPHSADYLREAFRTTVRFDRPEVGILLDPVALVAPIPTSDPTLKRVLHAYAQGLIDAANPRITTSQRVRDAMLELLASGFPDRARVARRLGVSERTLARSLEAEHTNYTALVDELRVELAIRRLQEGRVAIGDVAAELGFQDQSAFTKFFKRRAGVVPLEYRRRYVMKDAFTA